MNLRLLLLLLGTCSVDDIGVMFVNTHWALYFYMLALLFALFFFAAPIPQMHEGNDSCRKPTNRPGVSSAFHSAAFPESGPDAAGNHTLLASLFFFFPIYFPLSGWLAP